MAGDNRINEHFLFRLNPVSILIEQPIWCRYCMQFFRAKQLPLQMRYVSVPKCCVTVVAYAQMIGMCMPQRLARNPAGTMAVALPRSRQPKVR